MKMIFTVVLMVIAVGLLCGCSMTRIIEADAAPVDFTEAQNYFVLNSLRLTHVKHLVIKSDEEFHEVLGESPVMGKNGEPTPIDFKKQFVLAVILPETNRSTQVYPLSVLQRGDAVFFNYKVDRGEQRSYTITPFTAVVLDRPAVASQLEFYFNEK